MTNGKTRNLKLAIALGVLAVVAAVAWFEPTGVVRGMVRREPFFDGRPASAWANRLRDANEQAALEARRRLKAGGAEAAPVLGYLLVTRADGDWSSAKLRGDVIDILAEIGPLASAAVPSLIESLADPDSSVRGRAAETLGLVAPDDPNVVTALTAHLSMPEARSAARGLARCGPAGHTATDALITLLRNSDPDIRWNAARALGKIRASAAVAPLMILLDDPDDLCREHAAEALGDLGPEAAPAVGKLIATLKDRYPKARRDAARALGQIGPAAATAIPALETRVKEDSEDMVRRAAQTSLRQLGADTPKKETTGERK